ncbi:MAG: hypothetical protein ACRDN6_01575 [Gaiellaceae bacterium]
MLVLIGAASYEAAIAFGWLAIGPLPGEGRREEEQVLLVAVVALLVGAVLAASHAFGPRIKTAATESMIPLAAATFMTGRFYSFDPYYAPTLRRMSDGGFVAPWWFFTLLACSLLAGVLTKARPRVGSSVVAVVVPLCAVTAIAMGLGH